MSSIQRRKSRAVNVGGVWVGGSHPIVVQSMTNTDTADVAATVEQIKLLADSGSEIVRVTVNTEDAARAVPSICDDLSKAGYTTPVVGDFHYNGHLLLKKYPEAARRLAKYRINPGNSDIGKSEKNNFATMIEVALKHGKPVRIGANWGSLDKVLAARMMDENQRLANPLPPEKVTQNALVASALESAATAQKLGMSRDQIILSAKISHIQGLVEVYRALAFGNDYALHLGLTEAGMGTKGIVASSMAMGILLQNGIGDTVRVSITPEPLRGHDGRSAVKPTGTVLARDGTVPVDTGRPNSSRAQEVYVTKQILQSLDLRHFTPQVTSCPGCGRTTSTLFQNMAQDIQAYVNQSMPGWKARHPKAAEMQVAVMGCIVNGPGESKHANLGISLPGTAEDPKAPVYVDGKLVKTLQGANIVPEFIKVIENYVETHY